MVRKMDKLAELLAQEGFGDISEWVEYGDPYDSVQPGICMCKGCSFTTEVEPDSSTGWCDECNKNTVMAVTELVMGVL